MTANECTILEFFHRYQMGPQQMLFVNPGDCKLPANHFNAAMQSLMGRGLMNKERPNRAYSLTRQGYNALRSIARAARG